MSENTAPGREELLRHEEYRRLSEQHRQYEDRLSTLVGKAVLTDDEKIEETKLKKRKLQLKDRMETIARALKGH
jgi:uncharacterized protein YdcH (DUF465 family)